MSVIVVTGNIGAGKSTLAEALVEELKAQGHEVVYFAEKVEEFFLKLLYAGDASVATRDGILTYFQTEKQHSRWRTVIEAKLARQRGRVVVMDTDPRHDAVFAHVNLSAHALALYHELFAIYVREIGFEPDVRLFLDVTPARCLENVRVRARAFSSRESESAITLDYLARLDAAFHEPSDFTSNARLEVTLLSDDFVQASDVVERLRQAALLPAPTQRPQALEFVPKHPTDQVAGAVVGEHAASSEPTTA